MCFADINLGASLDLTNLAEKDTIKLLFAENSGLVFQAKDDSVELKMQEAGIDYKKIGEVIQQPELNIKNQETEIGLNINSLRDIWYKTSYLLDEKQTSNNLAKSPKAIAPTLDALLLIA